MAELEDFGDLSRAEREFADACQAGEPRVLGDGRLPDADDQSRHVRGELIRFFVLGGGTGTPVHERGIDLAGAVVTGRVDLSGATRDCDLVLKSCRFRRAPRLRGSHLRSLDLSGSACPGLDAEGLATDGAVRLGGDFHAQGTVRLVRSRIGSDLDCSGGRFDAPDTDALNADGAEIGGSLFLMGQSVEVDGEDPDVEPRTLPFRCYGSAKFISVNVGDSILILDALFAAGSRKYALNLAHVSVRRQLTMKRLQRFEGRLNLSGPSTYSLNDDPGEVNAPRDLILNGFTYVHFSSKAPTAVGLRLEWLARQRPEAYGQDFWAQPYGQLARVLHDIGHEGDARHVLVVRDTLKGRVSVRIAREQGRFGRMIWIWVAEQFMRRTIGYGYRPQRGLVIMALMIALTAVFFQKAWDAGAMTPAAAPVLVSADWKRAVAEHPDNPAIVWSAPEGAGRDYETFSAIGYAIDLFVPLIDLGQQRAWGPSTTRGWWGEVGWWLRWVVEIVGWVVTAVAAAAVTGLVRRG